MLVLVFYVEVFRHAPSVVRQYEVLDDCRQVGLLGKLHTLSDMLDDDARALLALQVLVGVDASLILSEESGVGHLADVVIQCSYTYEQAVGANSVCHLCCQVAHRYGVLECAGCHLAKVAQQSLEGVGKLEQRYVAGEAEHLLDEVHQRVRQQKQYTIDSEVGIHLYIELHHVGLLHHLHGEEHRAAAQRHEQCRLDDLCPVGKLAQRVYGHESCYELYDDELVLVFHRCRGYEHYRQLGDEGRA